LLHGCSSPNGYALDGVAVVSEIIASKEPKSAAERLATIYRAWASTSRGPTSFSTTTLTTKEYLIQLAGELLEGIKLTRPLVHQVRMRFLNLRSNSSEMIARVDY
jgi:thiamine-phosphate diphosphorylase / hydroxyethylthiazole kinase